MAPEFTIDLIHTQGEVQKPIFAISHVNSNTRMFSRSYDIPFNKKLKKKKTQNEISRNRKTKCLIAPRQWNIKV